MTMGIYAIVNNNIKKVYIGRSKNIESRFYNHKYDLRRKRHHNRFLQKDWYEYGEQAFSFHIVQECTLAEIEAVETEYIKKYRKNKLYNYDNKYHPWKIGNSSAKEYIKDADGDILPLRYCPNCELYKLANSFINSIYCLECTMQIEDEELEELEILEDVKIDICSKPIKKYLVNPYVATNEL